MAKYINAVAFTCGLLALLVAAACKPKVVTETEEEAFDFYALVAADETVEAAATAETAEPAVTVRLTIETGTERGKEVAATKGPDVDLTFEEGMRVRLQVTKKTEYNQKTREVLNEWYTIAALVPEGAWGHVEKDVAPGETEVTLMVPLKTLGGEYEKRFTCDPAKVKEDAGLELKKRKWLDVKYVKLRDEAYEGFIIDAQEIEPNTTVSHSDPMIGSINENKLAFRALADGNYSWIVKIPFPAIERKTPFKVGGRVEEVLDGGEVKVLIWRHGVPDKRRKEKAKGEYEEFDAPITFVNGTDPPATLAEGDWVWLEGEEFVLILFGTPRVSLHPHGYGHTGKPLTFTKVTKDTEENVKRGEIGE